MAEKKLKKNAGQASIEMVLMMIVVVGVSLTVANAFKSNDYFANLVSSPWQSLAGLIQNGVWGNPKATMAQHPGKDYRQSTVAGPFLE